MGNNAFWDFISETLQRLFQKSPRFFKWWQIISGSFAVLSGIPYLLVQFNVNLPEPFATMSNKAITFFAAGAWFMSKLTIKSPPVGQTKSGEAVTVLDKSKLPFTTKSEAKDVEQTVPPPPVITNVEKPKDK